MSLPAQHLSDEAVAAYADGVLSASARNRAARHVADCADCAHAVAEQRAAVFALRTAPAPALPSGLLERLRAVPTTTPLDGTAIALDPQGTAVFPAYGTRMVPDPPPLPGRRHATFGLLTAAAAVLTFSAVGVTAASSAVGGQPTEISPGPAMVSPVAALTVSQQR